MTSKMRIATSVVTSILPTLEQAEINRVKTKPTNRLDSYDLFLRGMALMYERSLLEACTSFQQAFALDPEYAAAYAMAAATLMLHHNVHGLPLAPDVRGGHRVLGTTRRTTWRKRCRGVGSRCTSPRVCW